MITRSVDGITFILFRMIFDPDSYNWLYHQQMIRSNLKDENLKNLKIRVEEHSFYSEYTNGVEKRQEGKIVDSLADFRKLLKRDQLNRIELLEATSRSLFLVGRYKQAAESLNMIKAIRNSNTNSKHHLQLGLCYRVTGQRAKAFEEIETSIARNPDDANLFEMAEIMLEGNFYDYNN